jgi:hypothetical protein
VRFFDKERDPSSQPDRAIDEKMLVFLPMSSTNTSDANPYTRAMTLMVLVQVDFEVMTKYLARKCICIEVNALATTLEFSESLTYDSNLDPDPVPFT